MKIENSAKMNGDEYMKMIHQIRQQELERLKKEGKSLEDYLRECVEMSNKIFKNFIR